jgi:hypothetical protein
MPMRRILLMLSSLTASGCAGINLEDRPLPAASPPPEGKRLAELANEAFAKAKLTGAPEVSAVRAAHDNQWGDWVFCIRSSSADQSLQYAVLIGHDAILEVRSSVVIDGCNQETYRPLAPAAPPVKAGGHK